MHPKIKQGLYAITDSHLITDSRLHSTVEAVLNGGAVMVQYRDKSADQSKRIQQATKLRDLCHRYHVPLIINDDIELTKRINADGVHLGKDDADIQYARKELGDGSIIGISCYNQLEIAVDAQAHGADYVAFGAFFHSRIKENAVKAEISLIETAKQQLKIPIVAIGGITVDNGLSLIEAGADQLAVISALFDNGKPQQSAQQFSELFNH